MPKQPCRCLHCAVTLQFFATSTGECLETDIKREDGAPLSNSGNPVTAPATVNELVDHYATARKRGKAINNNVLRYS